MLDITKSIIDYYKDKNLSVNEISKELDKAKLEVLENFLDNDKLYVKKRSGRIDIFNIDKVLKSVKNAARNKNIDLNTSDISIIRSDLEKRIKQYSYKVIPTKEIKKDVEEILLSEGYKRIHDSYSNYIK
ncbi:MAG: ATP cone domain-containing protein [Tissierellia bacterium]|nr:ATP cone domain-containing protein [Tissierellia bacterium]